MASRQLQRRLDSIAQRYVLFEGLFNTGWSLALLGLLAGAFIWQWRPSGVNWLLTATVVVGLASWLIHSMFGRARRRQPSSVEIARRIESLAPQFDARLVTAVEQAPNLVTGRFTLLQEQVMEEAAASLHGGWAKKLVPAWKIASSSLLIGLDLLLLLLILVAMPPAPQPLVARSSSSPATPLPGDQRPVTVEPGDVELERGSSLLVMARFHDALPARVTLQTSAVAGENGKPASAVPTSVEQSLAMNKALDDPVFGTRIPSVQHDLQYRVLFDDEGTREFRVTVYDLPALVQGDLVVQPPSYTQLAEKRYPKATEVTVVERSMVTIECQVNKPMARVELQQGDEPAVAMTVDPRNPLLWKYSFVPEHSVRLKLNLVDDRDRRNRDPEQFRIDVVPNQRPKLELAFPGKDVRVSPLEELSLEGRAFDDFGLEELGLVVSVAGRDPVTIPLEKGSKTKDAQAIQIVQSMEELKVSVDDLVSYYLFAVDRGPDGKARKTTGDIFFVEVRPFEETFRQMESPPGGAAQSGAQAQASGNQFEDLVQVQKQVVAATWNLIRDEETVWSEKMAEKQDVITDSQETNKKKLLDLMVHLPGAAQQRAAQLAIEQMNSALTSLQQSREAKSKESLNAAVTAEQGAYQLLLKLRAREHNVMQGQQAGGGSGGGASPSEQQLQELELSEKQNRYETRTSAGEQAESAQQEELQSLDRLKELAHRQGDLNKKLKELDAALRLSQSAAEKEEIERQLKRLRDEQQQLLQDADELRNRLAQSQRQENFRETREQLEQTRQRMLDATEALQEGQLSQAINSSARAERELQDLQQEFREQTSARFAETLRDLRSAARELTERQKQLSQQLGEQKSSTPERNSLRSENSRQDLPPQFEQQRAQLNELLNRARDVVQQSEASEPLLSRQLYDTLRKTRDDQLEPAMEAVPQLLQRGFVPEAQKAEQQAREGLDHLQAGIDQAAESVLGNEIEALKRARVELAELSQQLQSELQQQQQRATGANGLREAGKEGSPEPTNGQPSTPEKGPPNETSPAADSPDAPKTAEGTGKTPTEGSGNGQPAEGPSAKATGQAKDGSPIGGESQRQTKGQGQGQGQREAEGTGAEGRPPGEQGSGQGAGGQESGGQGEGAGSGEGMGQNPGENSPGGLRGGRGAPGNRPGSASGSPLGGQQAGGMRGGPGGQGGPISGDGYREWSERLRDIETMVADPDLQADVSRLREQARSLRAEANRHSEAPNWELVKSSLYEPMVELQRRLSEEVAKRESNDALVPIDRDPVPARYKNLVRSYYQRLGEGGE